MDQKRATFFFPTKLRRLRCWLVQYPVVGFPLIENPESIDRGEGLSFCAFYLLPTSTPFSLLLSPCSLPTLFPLSSPFSYYLSRPSMTKRLESWVDPSTGLVPLTNWPDLDLFRICPRPRLTFKRVSVRNHRGMIDCLLRSFQFPT